MNIILTHLPPKPGFHSKIHAGFQEVSANFIEALLKYVISDRIIVYTPSSRMRDFLNYRNAYSIPERIELLDADAIDKTIHESEPTIIQTLITSLKEGIHLRFLCNSRPWPVIGMTHDLSSAEVYNEILLTLIGKPAFYDSIACSTKCAKEALQKLTQICSSALNCNSLLQMPIIPLGIELDDFNNTNKNAARLNLQISEDKLTILYLGRISNSMKADLLPLISTFNRVQDKCSCKLIIAGSLVSPDAKDSIAHIKNYIKEAGLETEVLIQTDISKKMRLDILSAVDILVVPADSFQESFGLVLLEAMAMSLPIIASDWNGYREVIENSKTGFLIETLCLKTGLSKISKRMVIEDRSWWYGEFAQSVVINQNQLEEAMLELLENQELRVKIGIAARIRVEEHYSWNYIISLHYKEWERLTKVAEQATTTGFLTTSPYWYDHSEVFKNHPTGFFDLNSKVKATKHYSSLKQFEICFPPSFISSEILRKVIACMTETISIKDIPVAGHELTSSVSYLLKHNYAEIIYEQD